MTFRVPLVFKVHKELKASKVSKVFKEHRVSKGSKAHRVHRVSKVFVELNLLPPILHL